ncbi:hypothetical protein VOM14_09515 [Paraburkholderia sp. MPAMCS5]|uniref:hypothetical protein n=1 Tax=Paraburkholderia sp. MPAMCS5 TaxID=3112563 RepID=UPI002E187951|nr:hypothetical protein [Paraburkholderia sp. MPAMCS5]
MFTNEALIRLCTPTNVDGPYLRPFVCRGPLSTGGAMIVGVNPATPITAEDGIQFDDYASSLLNIENFLPIYDAVRTARGKPRRSNTRIGLDTASAWLTAHGFSPVVDSNISPRPTESETAWAKLSKTDQSMWVFDEVVKAFRPSLVLLHGKRSYEVFTERYAPELRSGQPFNELVKQPRLGTVNWRFGGTADAYVCKHIRFFRGDGGGKYFQPLRQALHQS